MKLKEKDKVPEYGSKSTEKANIKIYNKKTKKGYK